MDPHLIKMKKQELIVSLPIKQITVLLAEDHANIRKFIKLSVELDGDIEVVERFAKILKPGGLFLMTAPCGRDAVMAPWCRVYGEARLPRLFAPFQVTKDLYWVKNAENQWVECTRETAMSFETRYDALDAHGCLYALGGFVLRKQQSQ